jgi:hypothetical protein
VDLGGGADCALALEWNERGKSDRINSLHWRVRLVPEHESSSENCLHCEINYVVREHVEPLEKVDLAGLAARMTESLVELILLAPEEEHAKLLAGTIAHLGHAFLGKSVEIEDGQDTAH